jgi:hypothetical protein
MRFFKSKISGGNGKQHTNKVATISRGTKDGKLQSIDIHKAQLGVKRLAVSHRGYYDWVRRGESVTSQSDRQLLFHIRCIFKKSRGIYGNSRSASKY